MNNDKYLIGVDVGGTNIRIGAVSHDIVLEKEDRIATKEISGPNTADRLLAFIDAYIRSNHLDVEAVAIGFPSLLDRERTTVISTANIVGLDDVLIRPRFENALNLPVLIEKDGCMLMHYDMHQHDLSEGVLIGIYVGTGLGNIILIDGKPVIGKDGVAGELGHIPILGKDDICSCGLTGCLEQYAAGKGLEIIRRKHFPGTHISEMFVKHGKSQELEQFVQNIAKAIVFEIHILNPDHIVLGGGVLAMEEFPYDALIDQIHRLTRKPVPESTLNIFRSDTSNQYSGVIGAAIYAKNVLRHYPAE